MTQSQGGWSDGSRRFAVEGKLFCGVDGVAVNLAFRFGAQLGEKAVAVGDLKLSETSRTTAIRTRLRELECSEKLASTTR